jgi:Uma2 family endonuclease
VSRNKAAKKPGIWQVRLKPPLKRMLRLKTALTNKITEDNIQGSPDLIVEVISEGTEVKDRREKKNLYEKFGVKEYILVFPEREYVERYCLKKGKYGSPEIFNWDEILKLTVFEFEINLWEIFEKEKPKPAKPEPN